MDSGLKMELVHDRSAVAAGIGQETEVNSDGQVEGDRSVPHPGMPGEMKGQTMPQADAIEQEREGGRRRNCHRWK